MLTNLLRKVHAERVDDESGQPHIVFTLDKLGHGISRDGPRAVENYSGDAPVPWSAHEGRPWNRKAVKSLRAEWRDTGSIRLSLCEI